MNIRSQAEKLAKQAYLVITSIDSTTDDLPVYFARAYEVEGCFGQGDTPDEAIADLHLAMVDFFESLLEDGLPMPDPTPLSSTHGDTEGVFIFTMQGQQLQPKPSEVHQDSYLLLP